MLVMQECEAVLKSMLWDFVNDITCEIYKCGTNWLVNLVTVFGFALIKVDLNYIQLIAKLRNS